MKRVCAGAAAVLLAAVVTAGAETVSLPGGEWRLGVGISGGARALDPHLADYRWEVGPSFETGAHATLYRGRVALGVRVLRGSTTQSTGIPGETQAPRVNLTSVQMLGQFQVFGYRGVALWGSAHGGRFHMGYDPDRLTFDVGALTGPVTVAYDPVSEWDFGMGLEIRGEFSRRVALGVQLEGSTFALNTSHRSGSEIVDARERFYSWTARLELSWLLWLG